MDPTVQNSDLWKVLDKVIDEIRKTVYGVEFKRVPAHVGIYDNEKSDRFVKAVMLWEREHTS